MSVDKAEALSYSWFQFSKTCVCLAGTHTRLYPEKGALADVSRFSAGIRHLEDVGLEFLSEPA